MNQWKVGDVVWHKSGGPQSPGPKMVVMLIDGKRVKTEWFDEAKGKFENEDFGPEELTDKEPQAPLEVRKMGFATR